MQNTVRGVRFFVLVGALAVGASGCTLPADLLEELPCPCGDGWRCDQTRDVCVEQPQLANGNLGTCLVPLSDDFNDGTVDPDQWDWVTDDDATVTEADGRFVATVPENSTSDYAFLAGPERVDLSDCAVALELVEVDLSNTSITLFGLRDTNDRSFGWSVKESVLRGGVYVIGEVDINPIQIPYDPVEHRWLALRGDGENLFWLASPDGSTWNILLMRPPDFDESSVQLIFGIGADEDGPEIISRFDNLNILP